MSWTLAGYQGLVWRAWHSITESKFDLSLPHSTSLASRFVLVLTPPCVVRLKRCNRSIAVHISFCFLFCATTSTIEGRVQSPRQPVQQRMKRQSRENCPSQPESGPVFSRSLNPNDLPRLDSNDDAKLQLMKF